MADVGGPIEIREFPPDGGLLAGVRMTGIPTAVSAANALEVAGKWASYYSVGVIYDKGPLQAQFMVSHTSYQGGMFQNQNVGYGLIGYRVGAVTPYFGYSKAKSKSRHLSTGLPDWIPQFAEMNAGVATMMSKSHVDQQTYFGGIRWDVTPNVAAKIQFDCLRGKPSSVSFQQWESPAWNGKTNVVSATIDFIF